MSQSASILPLTASVAPSDQSAVADVLRDAAAAGTPVYPIGGGTRLDYGADPSRPGLGLSLAGLGRVIDYPARDLTITVEAGVTLSEVNRRLAAERQRLPVDIPQSDRATVGGAVATNQAGPRRYRWGSLRDYVIGIRAVDGTGMAFAGGGRVVKNAAGYDLCRLLTGSLGSLGVITQVTLMVKPQPETSAFLIAPVSDWALAERLLADLVQTRTLPSAIELLAGPGWAEEPRLGPAVRSGAARLAVGLEGSQGEVEWMIGQLLQEWQRLDVTPAATLRDGECGPLWDCLAEFPASRPEADGAGKGSGVFFGQAAGQAEKPSPEKDSRPLGPWVIEARVLASACVACVEQVLAADPGCTLQAHAGSGVIRARLSAPPDQGIELIDRRIRPAVATSGGTVVVLGRPAGPRVDRHTAWGPPGDHHALMQSLHNQFDPQGILNPGRFIFAER